MTAVTRPEAVNRFAYNPHGNLIRRVEISGTRPIIYLQTIDGKNRLSVVTNTVSGEAMHFAYDGDGARVLEDNALIALQDVEPPLYGIGADPGTAAAGEQVVLWATVRGEGHPDGGSPTVKVRVYPPAGEMLVLTGTTPGTTLWTWEAPWHVPDGWPSEDVILSYEAVDQDDLVGRGEVVFSIRNVPPAPEITGPPWLVRTQPYYTADPDLYLRGLVRSQDRVTVTLYVNDEVFADTRSGYWFPGMGSNWAITMTLPSEGRYDLSAAATSDYGLTSPRGPTRTVILDTQPPTVTLSALPPFTNALGLAFDWQSSDAGSSVVAHALERNVDGTWVRLVSGGANYTHTYLSLGSRRYEFRVSARDSVGNVGFSAIQHSVVDRIPPEIALRLVETSTYAHAAGTTLYYGPGIGVFTVTAEIEDPLAGLTDVAFPATTSGGAIYDLAGAAAAASAHVYTFTAGAPFSGTSTVSVGDRATNAGEAAFTVARDATPPSLWLDLPARLICEDLAVTWGGSDAQSGVAGYDLALRIDEGAWQTVLTDTQYTHHTFVDLPGEAYEVRVTARDHVDNATTVERRAERVTVTKYYLPYVSRSLTANSVSQPFTTLSSSNPGRVFSPWPTQHPR